MFIELHTAKKPEGEGYDWDKIGMDPPEDYEVEYEKTLVNINTIQVMYSSDKGESVLEVDSFCEVLVCRESYGEVVEMIGTVIGEYDEH